MESSASAGAGSTGSPARQARGAWRMGAGSLGLVDNVLQRLHGPAVFRLSQPEKRALLEIRAGVTSGDIDQLIQRSGLAPLRVHKDELLAHFPIADVGVELGELIDRDATLPGPEQRLLPHLQTLGRVARHPE